ncbi:hypothetical protein ACH33_04040 [Aneurinibacillus sp. XH2]|nr:hypothetical protein ACH33_04040 [Aneurinibacillus sp. XH2]
MKKDQIGLFLVFFVFHNLSDIINGKYEKEWWASMLNSVQIVYYILWFTVIGGLLFMMVKILSSRD